MPAHPRPPIRHCPLCGIAMVSSKSDEQSAGLDTFSCLSCKTTITLAPPPQSPEPNQAARFNKTFAVIGVGSERARCSQHRGKQRTKAKQLHENLRQFELILLLSSLAPQHHEADWILQS